MSLLAAADVRAGTVVDVAGLIVRLGADDDQRAEAVASLLREAPSVADTVAVDCELVHGARPPVLPARAPDVEAESVRQWRTDGVLHVAVGDVVARADAASIVVGGGDGSAASSFRAATVHAFGHCFAARGRSLVHGCAVVTDAGALLVVGESGVGKSTLAWAAVRSGLPVVSDDAVVLDPPTADGDVWAVGLPRPIAVPADVVGDAAVTDGRPVPGDPRARTEVPPGARCSGPVRVVGLVVAVGEDPRGAGIAPSDGPEALRAVLRSSVAFADPDRRAATFALAGALARLPAWDLRRGGDPQTALVDVTACLERLGEALGRPAGTPG